LNFFSAEKFFDILCEAFEIRSFDGFEIMFAIFIERECLRGLQNNDRVRADRARCRARAIEPQAAARWWFCPRTKDPRARMMRECFCAICWAIGNELFVQRLGDQHDLIGRPD
jgi:ferredoxin-thioredoxin reductase catalytic subunit